MKEKLKKLIPSRRKIIQLYCALLFNANLKGFVTGNIYTGKSKQFCAPGINCYSCPGAVAACPLGSLQGSFSADKSTIYYVCGILVLYAVLFGRMICGWFCPFGLIQELLYKIKTPKLKKSPVTRILSYLKYVILVFFVFIVPITYAFRDTPLPSFCKYICPAGTIEGGLLLLSNKVNASYFSMLGPIFTWKFMLMISIVMGSVFIFRLFCRFICPLGALYGLFNKISVFGIKVEQSKCVDCNLCVSHCKMDIMHVGDQECISCGECIDVCPTKAISFKGSRVFLKANEIPAGASDEEVKAHEAMMKKRRTITRSITAVIMAAVLIGAIVYYWNEDAVPAVSNDASYGTEVGDLCYGYDLEIIDGSGVTGETIDPTQTGKLTIINFWGTWCTPCVNELPYFDQIASEYPEDVAVITVHSALSSETAPAYIDSYYPESNMIFTQDYAADETGITSGYYTSLGGRGTYPYTVILDENGVILSVFFESVEYEDLKEVVSSQLTGSTAAYGIEVGSLCYGYDLEVIDGSGVTGETVDPSQTGKITIINFWGTWCTPCVNELPYFDQIASDYADSVAVVAVHSALSSETAPAYIGSFYPDSRIIFAQDYTLDEASLNSEYYTTLGGRGTWPYTVVLDENGMIISVFFSSVEYEDLQEIVDSQLAK